MKFKRNADGSLYLDDAGNPVLENPGEEIENIVKTRVEESVKDIKGKLDIAFKSRDEATKELAAAKEQQRLAELARLESEGKHQEVAELKIAKLTGELETYRNRVTELTRDAAVDNAISGLNFQNASAARLARSEIISNLVCDDQGVWKHKTGASISDFVKTFESNEENSYLFKQKTSSGAGFNGTGGTPDVGGLSGKKMSELSTNEIFALISAGKLTMQS